MRNTELYERAKFLGSYVVQNNATVRGTATKFKISKSTVHKNITKDLREINLELYKEVKKVLDQNKQERSKRGGEATKQKLLQKKNNHLW